MGKQFPNRQSIRLREYDYSSEGLYFVTICCQDKACLLGKVKEEVGVEFYSTRNEDEHHPLIELSALGQSVFHVWLSLSDIFPGIVLHEFIIMPNHMHGIIEISQRAGQSPAPTLGNIVGAFKSISTKRCNTIDNASGRRIWQRNYYEHIIRNTKEYENITHYTYDNPANWLSDDYFSGDN